jgi:hypothetical protein
VAYGVFRIDLRHEDKYHKSDLTPINLDEEEVQEYAKVFFCKIGGFPFKYLGVSYTTISLEGRIYNSLWIQ